MNLHIMYAGSINASKEVLQYIVDSKMCSVKCVLTTKNSPVEKYSKSKNIMTISPDKLDESVRNTIVPLKLDLLVCFAYGKYFGPKFLSCFKYSGVNIHPSNLPRYRGPSPIQSTILSDEKFSATTLQVISDKIDSGNIIFQCPLFIDKIENYETLMSKHVESIKSFLPNFLENFSYDKIKNSTPQDINGASTCYSFATCDLKINWNSRASNIDRFCRAFYRNPGAWTTLDGERIKIGETSFVESEVNNLAPGTILCFFDKNTENHELGLYVTTAHGQLIIKSIQRECKKEMDIVSFMRGVRGPFLSKCFN